jgi:hypothetical protein
MEGPQEGRPEGKEVLALNEGSSVGEMGDDRSSRRLSGNRNDEALGLMEEVEGDL